MTEPVTVALTGPTVAVVRLEMGWSHVSRRVTPTSTPVVAPLPQSTPGTTSITVVDGLVVTVMSFGEEVVVGFTTTRP